MLKYEKMPSEEAAAKKNTVFDCICKVNQSISKFNQSFQLKSDNKNNVSFFSRYFDEQASFNVHNYYIFIK